MKHLMRDFSFRPLDGESISKLGELNIHPSDSFGFRPLDGESISKHTMMGEVMRDSLIAFPSPRRGINF